MTTIKANDVKDPVARTILGYVQESDMARRDRMLLNEQNYNCYHLKGDWTHKREGQSKEYLAKTQGATEQLTSFLQQGLIDQGKWFDTELQPGIVDPLITADEMRKILEHQLGKTKFTTFFADALKTGLLASLMIAKVGGKMSTCADFFVEKKRGYLPWGKDTVALKKREQKIWELDISLIRPEDFFPDPHADGLYEVQRVELDLYRLIKMAEEHNEKHRGEFDMEVIKALHPGGGDLWQQSQRARETGQNPPTGTSRPRQVLYECWGTLLDESTGRVLEENVVSVITEDGQVVRKPSPNPWWHQESPFVSSSIVRVPFSVWHRALMDAAVRHNLALNELYNLMVDGGLMSVWGIKQMREDWVDDPEKYANGIAAGETVMVNSQCPAGMKAIERVDTSNPNDQTALSMFNLIDREHQQSSMSSDIRSGSLPQRAVKATEIVASNQAITGVFNGVVKNIEDDFVGRILRKSWMVTAQNMNDLNLSEMKALLGADRAQKLATVSPQERFASTVKGVVYKVFGLSMTVNKINDFRKISTLLQTIGTSNTLINEFQQKYSFTKLLGEIIRSLDINEDKIKLDPEEKARIEKEKAMQMQLAAAQAGAKGGGGKTEDGGKPMSQVPSMAGTPNETGMEYPQNEVNGDITQAGMGGT
jgi:hypothetical protein